MQVEDMPAGQMRVCFPDTMQEETRRQTAFYETDIRCHPNRLYSLEDGHQGIWWEDDSGVPLYLMTDGISEIRPSPKPVRKPSHKGDKGDHVDSSGATEPAAAKRVDSSGASELVDSSIAS